MSETWPVLKFTVPAMSCDVYTKNKITNKRVKKIGSNGQVVTVKKIIPKERPRFSSKSKSVFTPENTSSFESWIRNKFFEAYPGNCGVYVKNKAVPVHSAFLGCRTYGENVPCLKYRKGRDFLDCQVCQYRRKNLILNLNVYLKDERHLDLDNVVKIVLDALEKVCFFNDSQFVVKHVELIPHSEKEKLEIEIGVLPVTFKKGSLVGGYPISRLSVKEASDYITNFKNEFLMGADKVPELLEYLLRCDKRKYITLLAEGLLND